ncbi:MAG TPA: BTAD domain-containing putative transcriptional regulator [Acidimicrobiia bacterium]
MAVHTGEAVERDGDYFGPVVNRAARLRSVSSGGDVVLSQATAALVAEALPENNHLHDIGEISLRDLDRPERVFVVAAEALEVAAHFQIRLLGQFRATLNDTDVEVGGPKERSVLALLALADGPMTHERLIAGLWGEDPPSSARKTLQTYIWRLRQSIPEELLSTVSGGYQLSGAGSDARRFEQLVDDGGTAAREDPSRALQLYEQALATWRGDPFSGCASTTTLDTESSRLAELRLRAAEGRCAAALDLGHHAELVGELEQLLEVHPFREELWRMLILAHYRSGRQADALRSFQRARTQLIQELGVEPGPRLRELEQDLLHQRIDLVPEERAEPAHTSARHRWLPTARLVGRDRERSELRSSLDDHRLVTLTGLGGAGKTRLAQAIAAEFEPETVAFCDLSTARTSVSVVTAIIDGLGASGDALAPADPLETVFAHIDDREILLVADNCEGVLDAAAPVVASVLARCPGVQVLATSRAPLGLAGERVMHLGPLRVPVDDRDVTADAAVLFAERATAARPDFTPDSSERAATLEICRRLDGLPLAIELAAARMSHLSAPELLARLDRRFELLVASGEGRPERHRTLRATIDWSYGLLSDEERAVFRVLAVFSGWFDITAAEACCGSDLDVVTATGGLVDKSLLAAEHTGAATRYRFLESIHLFARERLAGSNDEVAARDAHADWCLAQLDRVPWDQRLLSPQTAEELEGAHGDLLLAVEWSAERMHLQMVADLVASMSGLLMIGAHFDELDQWFHVAIDIESSYPPGRRIATAAASLVYMHRFDGDLAHVTSHFRRLAALIENFPAGHPVTAVGYATLASICSRLPAERHSMERYADLALHHVTADTDRIRTMAQCQKARALLFRGDHDAARELLEAALTESVDDDATFSLAEDLALAHHLAGDNARARDLAESRMGKGPALFGHLPAILASVAAHAAGDDAAADQHLETARIAASASPRHPLSANDIRLAEGTRAAIAGDRCSAATLLEDLGPASVSTNSMVVLLEHYAPRNVSAIVG